jgi:PAS domain-containing protein
MDLRPLGIPDWLANSVADVPEAAWAALVSALVTLGLSAVAFGRRSRQTEAPREGGDDPACDFLINGSSLSPLTGAARALLDGLGGRHAPLQALTRHLEADCPAIQDDLEGLILFGAAFRRHCQRGDATSYEVSGQPQGGAALLSIRPASAEARALDAAERELGRVREEASFQREALDRAPILVWTLGPDNQVGWANAAYRERFDLPEAELAGGIAGQRHPDVFAHVLEEVPLTARAGRESRRRVRIPSAHESDPHWFEVSQIPLSSGETLSYAIEADELVAAEASLRRFVETLTETFAHLPIGLAVFDKNRRLGLFNPALCDLVKIDAVWLAGRPCLRDFLERLRETRQMPEQKDFAAFRRMLTELEKSAREGTYEENWVLPSGKIFRVSGRPHPQGALAFLFEDISTAIQLERRYRAELELSQATLDRMSEAIAVFDTSGMLVFVNSAFERLWQIDPMASLDGPGVADLSAIWERRCAPSPLWADLRAFATGADNRTSWTGSAATLDGRCLTVLVAPLPNGSTLVTFRDRAAPETQTETGDAPGDGLRRASLLSGLAFAEVEAPADAALGALGAAIAASPDPRAFAGLTQAAQALKDGLARGRVIQARAEAATGGEDTGSTAALAERLALLLGTRGLALGPVVEHGGPAGTVGAAPAALAPALGALALAAGALAAPGSEIELVVDRRADAASVALHLPLPPAAANARETEPAALALARRRIAALGAAFETARDDDGLTLAARFPACAAPHALAAAG